MKSDIVLPITESMLEQNDITDESTVLATTRCQSYHHDQTPNVHLFIPKPFNAVCEAPQPNNINSPNELIEAMELLTDRLSSKKVTNIDLEEELLAIKTIIKKVIMNEIEIIDLDATLYDLMMAAEKADQHSSVIHIQKLRWLTFERFKVCLITETRNDILERVSHSPNMVHWTWQRTLVNFIESMSENVLNGDESSWTNVKESRNDKSKEMDPSGATNNCPKSGEGK